MNRAKNDALPAVAGLDLPPGLAKLHWRGARLSDLPAIFALQLACDEFDGTENAGTMDQLSRELEDPWLGERANNTLLALDAEGDAAAFARILANPEPVGERRVHIRYAAHPAYRAADLEGFLLSWLEWRGTRTHESLDASISAVLSTSVDAGQRARVRLVEKQGFTAVRYFFRMRRGFDMPLPDAELPEGLAVRPYGPDLQEPLRAAYNEAFSEHWGFDSFDRADWELWIVGRAGFRADLTFLAMDGPEIAAFALAQVDPPRTAAESPTEGWISDIGTRKLWRRRGLATALIVRTLRAFQAEGIQYAVLGVDADNPTGALGLYEQIGFIVYRRFIRYEKKVSLGK